jgi:peroxiredoxin (alkyl hydroperoxide reductase subunit C)
MAKEPNKKEIGMAGAKDGCVKPARGVIGAAGAETAAAEQFNLKKEIIMTAKVGKPAPDFEVNAFVNGGFENITLSKYKGQWVVLCFYPGDFTFV